MLVLGIIILILLVLMIFLGLQLKKEKQSSKHTEDILSAVSADYVSLHELDLKNDVFNPIKTNAAIEKLTQQLHSNIQFQMQNIMKGLSAEGSRDSILEFVNTDTLLDRMKDRKLISCDFEGVKSGWCRAEFLWLNKEKLTLLYGVRTIDADKTREDGLRYLAERDFLTGVFNAESGKQRVANALLRNETGMFGLFEVDDFKQINDTLGSEKGDELIAFMASAIQKTLGSDAIVFRRGGVRFAAFLKDLDDKNDARYLMKQLLDCVEEYSKSQLGMELSMNVGVAFYRCQMDQNIDDLIANAESSLSTSRSISGVSVSYFD